MTPWLRAIYGALLGSILTLLIHPTSRSFLVGAFEVSRNPALRAKTELPGAFPDKLTDPKDAIMASLWIHVAAEKLLAHDEVSPKELDALISLSRNWQRRDPTNAFWRFAVAIFLDREGKKDEARREWVAASKCIGYDDQQSNHLASLREGIQGRFLAGSWQYAYTYRLRSISFARLVQDYATDMIGTLSMNNEEDLRLRYATLVDGALLRNGSRNLSVMTSGSAVLELASHPRELKREISIKRLLIAHSQFKEALVRFGLTAEAEKVEGIYNENDGWGALTRLEDTEENAALLTMEGSILATLPGSLLLVAAYGYLVYLAGTGLRWISNRDEGLFQKIALVAGVALTVLSMLLTHSALAVVATGLACGFVLVKPQHTRRRPPEGLGPLFTFANLILSAAFVLLSAVFFLSRTIPVVANIEAFATPIEVFANADLMAGFSLIVLSLLFLISPLWALAQRIRTSVVMHEAFRMFGTMVTTMSLLLAAVTTPLCIHFENETRGTLRDLVRNEPLYYLNKTPGL